MSRKLKNIIMLVLIIVLGISMYFTISQAKIENRFMGGQIQRENGENVPSMPNDNMMSANSNEITEPPAKPEWENDIAPTDKPETMMQQNGNIPTGMSDDVRNMARVNNQTVQTKYYLFMGLESLGIALLIMYLIMSNFNKKTFKETLSSSEKIIIYILSIIIITTILTALSAFLTNRFFAVNDRIPNGLMEEEKEKETKADDVEAGESVTVSEINLSNHSSNITITKAGEYTLTGNFEYAVLVNADGEVILNLNNVTINNSMTAAIANISQNPLKLNLVDGTTNTLIDGGASEYDACIYSAGPLTISENGKLNVYGKQEEGEGIATETNDITINGGEIYIESADDGLNAGGDGGTITINNGLVYIKASGDGIDSNKNLVINGGTVYTMGSSVGGDAGIDTDGGFSLNGGLTVALGTDMLVTPLTTSGQKSLCFNLSEKIPNGTLITLVNEKDEVIVSFEASEDFKTLIISSDKLENGTYTLYKDGKNTGTLQNGIYQGGSYEKGTAITINNNSSFTSSGTVTNIGTNR